MEFLPQNINDYCLAHTTPESALLAELDRQTHLKILMPRMLSGHLQGRFLAMIVQMLQPQNILEIGTYTGYSALCLAEGLPENGTLTTIDINEELEDFVRSFFEKSAFKHKITYKIGNAIQIIPTLTQTFDLVFIDADKVNNATYFDLVLDKVRKKGFILIDNVLWSGKVAQNLPKTDKDTKQVQDFNQKIQNDERLENMLLPLRDGIMIVRKK